MICDIGGTTADFAYIKEGKTREKQIGAEIAGVRTNFRFYLFF